MLLSEYIKMLQDFAAGKPDLPVAMTESGYYSGGHLADLYDMPEVKEHTDYVYDSKTRKSTRVKVGPYYSLGHSHQSY